MKQFKLPRTSTEETPHEHPLQLLRLPCRRRKVLLVRSTPIRLILALFVVVLTVTAFTTIRSTDNASPPTPAPETLPPLVQINYGAAEAAVAQADYSRAVFVQGIATAQAEAEFIRAASEAEAARQAEAAKRAAAAKQSAPQSSASVPRSTSGFPWDLLAQCEAGGNWATNTANGYSGGLQFAHSTWTSMGGGQYAPYAWQATREQQIAIAEKVLAVQGPRAWPGCTAKLGLR